MYNEDLNSMDTSERTAARSSSVWWETHHAWLRQLMLRVHKHQIFSKSHCPSNYCCPWNHATLQWMGPINAALEMTPHGTGPIKFRVHVVIMQIGAILDDKNPKPWHCVIGFGNLVLCDEILLSVWWKFILLAHTYSAQYSIYSWVIIY